MALPVPMAAARKLFSELGSGDARKWDAKAMLTHLKGLPKIVEGAKQKPDLSTKSEQLLDEVTEAVKKKRKIEVIEDAEQTEEAEAPTKKKGKKKIVVEEAEEETEEEAEEEEEEKPAKKAKKKPVKKKAQEDEEEEDESEEEESEDEEEESEDEESDEEEEPEEDESEEKVIKKKKKKKKVEAERPTKKKKAKATKADQPKAKKKKKASGGGKAEKDKFGARMGTQCADINACISEKPRTISKIVEKFPDFNNTRVRGHIRFLVGKGFVKVTDDDKVVQKKVKVKG